MPSRAACATESKDDGSAVEVVYTDGRHAAANPGRQSEVAEVERPEIADARYPELCIMTKSLLCNSGCYPVRSGGRNSPRTLCCGFTASTQRSLVLASSRNPVALIPLEDVTRLLRRGRVSRLN